MTRTRVLAMAPLLLLVVLAGPALGAAQRASSIPPPTDVSGLAFRHLEGVVRPELVLAQRVIDREWGPSDDSIYVELDLPGWKSEPLAAALSAGLPGAGQYYLGERRAWVFAAIEVAGWGGWWWYRHDARRLRDEAAGLAGAPEDPASGWSFERWSAATQGDPSGIAALYAADREAFFNSITSDPLYLPGWETAEARAEFGALRLRSDQRLGRSRVYGTGLWLNHLIASLDALRAARYHNMPLSRDLGLRIDRRSRRAGATFAVAIERKF